MKKALCPLCNTRHMLTEPHSFVTDVTEVPEVVTKVISIPPKPVTKVPPFEQMNSEMQETVLAGAESYGMSREDALAEFKKMGRPRKYKTHAERQAAYRARKRTGEE